MLVSTITAFNNAPVRSAVTITPQTLIPGACFEYKPTQCLPDQGFLQFYLYKIAAKLTRKGHGSFLSNLSQFITNILTQQAVGFAESKNKPQKLTTPHTGSTCFIFLCVLFLGKSGKCCTDCFHCVWERIMEQNVKLKSP